MQAVIKHWFSRLRQIYLAKNLKTDGIDAGYRKTIKFGFASFIQIIGVKLGELGAKATPTVFALS